MYGVIKMSNKFFAVDFNKMANYKKENYIENMLSDCIPITLVKDLEDANYLFNYQGEIEVIEPNFED